MLGVHLSHSQIPEAYSKGVRLFQIFIGSPQGFCKFDSLEKTVAKLKPTIPQDITIIVHAPYWFNFVNPAQKSKTMSYFKHQLKLASDLGAKYYIIHLGYRATAKTPEADVISEDQATQNLISFMDECKDVIEKKGVKVLFENCAGSKSGYMYGSFCSLLKTLTTLNSPMFGLCFDTAHAFANNEPVQDPVWFQNAVNVSTIVHCNYPSVGVTQGSHKDRHTDRSVRDAVVFLSMVYDAFTRNLIMYVLNNGNCKKVLETDFDIAMYDIELLREFEQSK